MVLVVGEQKSFLVDRHGCIRKGKAWWDSEILWDVKGSCSIVGVKLLQRVVGLPCAPRSKCIVEKHALSVP